MSFRKVGRSISPQKNGKLKNTSPEFNNATVKTHNIEWLQTCLDVGKSLKDGTDSYLHHCASAFCGDFTDACDTEVPYGEQEAQCMECWRKALL